MARRKQEPEVKKPEQSYADRLIEDRAKSIAAARRWVEAFDRLEREGKIEHGRSTVIAACETIALLGDADAKYYARRTLGRLDELGIGPDVRFSKHWRARLDGDADALMGTAIQEPITALGETFEFGQPERWSEEQ